MVHAHGEVPPAPHQVRQAVTAIIVPMILATIAGPAARAATSPSAPMGVP